MSNKTVLVTGGAGYIGSHVCKALSQQGFIPVTYDNLCSGNKDAVKWGPLEIGDIRDRKRLAGVMKYYKPVAIMHFAALIQVGASVKNPSEFYDNNVFGSFCLLEEAKAHGIHKMVFSSTAAVYGNPVSDCITEDHPLAPINPYGQTKLTMENMIRDYSAAYGLDYAILRYFNAAGADLKTDIGTSYKVDTHLIPLLMRVASRMMPEIQVFGTDYDTTDGTAVRDYIHVVDLAHAHIRALNYIMDGKQSITLNLGTSRGTSVQDVIRAARLVTQQPVRANEQARRAGDPAVLVADATLAQTLLNWKPAYSDIHTIVKSAWAWRLRQNGTVPAIMPQRQPGLRQLATKLHVTEAAVTSRTRPDAAISV